MAAPFTRAVFVIARHHDTLRRLGLDSMEGVKRFQGELIKNHKGQRDIQRLAVPADNAADSKGEKLVFYLKRNWKPYKKDGLKALFTSGSVRSASRVEWENSLALQAVGVGVAEPIAFGEECGPLWEKFSFILTAAARGDETLEHFLRRKASTATRQMVLDTLAKEIRRMHDAGLASPDLFTRHIFVAHGSPPEFSLIDMARLDRARKLSRRYRARDLAALNVTAPLRFVSRRERLRFLRKYGGDRHLRRLIQQRTRHLLERRKFADFLAP